MKRFLVTQLKRFDYGREQFARILSPISFVIVVFTFLKVYNISFTFQQILLLAFGALVLMYLIGVIWDKLALVEEEIEYTNERNRFVKALLGRGHKNWLNLLKKTKIGQIK